MAITFNAVGSPASGTGQLTTLTLPASFAAGDFHLLAVQTSNQDPGTITGWTAVTTLTGTGTGGSAGSVGLRAYWRIAVAGDTAPTVPDSGDHQLAWIAGWRGVDVTNPVCVFGAATASSAQAVTIAAVTTTVNNCFVIGLNANSVDSNTVQCTSFAAAGLTSVATILTTSTNTNSGTGGGVQGGYGTLAAQGTSGTMTSTQATGSVQAHLMIGIQPLITLTGQAATGAAQNGLTPVNTETLSGFAATTSQGALGLAVSLTGQAATTSEGSLTTSSTITLSGFAATGSNGALSSTTSQALSGFVATTGQGTITASLPDVTVALSGFAATGSAGTLTASSGPPVVILDDTHDGDREKSRFNKEKKARKDRREKLIKAFEDEFEPAPPAPVRARPILSLPAKAVTPSATIDFERVVRDAERANQMIQATERARLLEMDDEDVILLS